MTLELIAYGLGMNGKSVVAGITYMSVVISALTLIIRAACERISEATETKTTN